MRGGWRWGTALALALLGAPPAASQALGDPLVPAGRVRVDFWPSFTTWDSRFGHRVEGASSVEVLERLGSDLTDPLGTSLFPGVSTLEESLAALTGVDGYRGRLGGTSALVTKEVTRIDAGLHVGVFDWLTVGATVPWVKTRTAIATAFRPDADVVDLGLNPFQVDDGSVSGLLASLEAAASSAAAHAGAVCAGGSGPACDAAQTLSGRAADFSGRTAAAYAASAFFPLEGSPMAIWLQTALAGLNADLGAAGLPSVGVPMAFATETLGVDDFAAFPSEARSGLQGSPLDNIDGLWTLGDVELTTHVRLLQSETPDSAAETPSFSYVLTGGALVRLGTGTVDDPSIFLDIGSGDGQIDVEGRVDGSLSVGSRLALRAGARYGMQQSASLLRRVARHEHVLASPVTLRAVRWSPGSYTLLELSPRLRLNSELALAVDLRRYHKGEDSYELVGDPPPGLPLVDVAELGLETDMTVQEIGIGLRYSTLAAWRERRTGSPVQVGVRLVQAVAGSGGQTPKTTRFDVSVSLFRRIWGER